MASDIPSALKVAPGDPFDMMDLGAAVPAPNEPLELIALTVQQNACSL